MSLKCLLIDLDDTVYPSTTGLWERIRQRMELYMQDRMGIPLEEIPAMRTELYMTYGTTMRGLYHLYGIDQRDFLKFVHDVPLHEHLTPDPTLRDVLLQYPQKRIIFTNADQAHARRVLNYLQIGDCFDQVIDILDVAPYCKPQKESFEIALRLAGGFQPSECAMLDDSPRNLIPAKDMGMLTICVGDHPFEGCSLRIPSLHDLPQVIPLLDEIARKENR